MCKKTGARLSALQEDCLGSGGDSCGRADMHLSSPCKTQTQNKSETKLGNLAKMFFWKVPATLGICMTTLRSLVGFVIILQAHIELRKENAPGLWLS